MATIFFVLHASLYMVRETRYICLMDPATQPCEVVEHTSVFDLIKIGIGPSSSHTMGPWKAAAHFVAALGKAGGLDEVKRVEVELYGSLAKTGDGHGTGVAILMGLAGHDYTRMDTANLSALVDEIHTSNRLALGGKRDIPFLPEHVRYVPETTLAYQPNGMRFQAFAENGDTLSEQVYYSIGGGFIVAAGQSSQTGPDHSSITHSFQSARELRDITQRLHWSIPEVVFENERTWREPDAIRKQCLLLWSEMKDCIYRGVRRSGTLPGALGVKRRAGEMAAKHCPPDRYENVDDWLDAISKGSNDFNTINKWVSIFALAVNEENASFGRVVTAPTNGASGVLPAVLGYARCFTPTFSDQSVVDFILTAGAVGILYKKGATLSAAMGGCQAEIGVSSSMSAAALTVLLGGATAQALQAAEIAMEHHLGLTCDPVGGLVQIPCIERNSMGAIKSITASNMALESDPEAARISLDQVIKAMWNTAQDMNSKYKETSEGGLAAIPVNVIEC